MLWSILVVMLPSVVTPGLGYYDVVVYSCCNATFSCHSQVWSIMMLWSILVVMLPSVVTPGLEYYDVVVYSCCNATFSCHRSGVL